MRSVLWNYFKVDSVIESCDTVREGRKRATIRGSPRKQPASSHSGIFQHNSSTNKPTHKKGVLKKRRLCAQLRLKIRHPTYLWDGCVFFLQFSIVLTYKQRKSSQRCHFVERVEEDLLRSNGL